MKKVLLLIGLLAVSFSLGGQEAMEEHTCGASRQLPRINIYFSEAWPNKVDTAQVRFKMNQYSRDPSDDYPFYIEVGGLFTDHYRKGFGYGSGDVLPWQRELITVLKREDADFHYDIVQRNPDSTTLAQFKSEILKILNCRYGSINVISEGVDFLEYEANGMRFYHGFLLTDKLFGSWEMVGYSSIENYEARRALYVKTFENNRTAFTAFALSKGVKVLA